MVLLSKDSAPELWFVSSLRVQQSSSLIGTDALRSRPADTKASNT